MKRYCVYCKTLYPDGKDKEFLHHIKQCKQRSQDERDEKRKRKEAEEARKEALFKELGKSNLSVEDIKIAKQIHEQKIADSKSKPKSKSDS